MADQEEMMDCYQFGKVDAMTPIELVKRVVAESEGCLVEADKIHCIGMSNECPCGITARAAIRAIEQHYKIVAPEPTEEMMRAAEALVPLQRRNLSASRSQFGEMLQLIFPDMHAAAPRWSEAGTGGSKHEGQDSS